MSLGRHHHKFSRRPRGEDVSSTSFTRLYHFIFVLEGFLDHTFTLSNTPNTPTSTTNTFPVSLKFMTTTLRPSIAAVCLPHDQKRQKKQKKNKKKHIHTLSTCLHPPGIPSPLVTTNNAMYPSIHDLPTTNRLSLTYLL